MQKQLEMRERLVAVLSGAPSSLFSPGLWSPSSSNARGMASLRFSLSSHALEKSTMKFLRLR